MNTTIILVHPDLAASTANRGLIEAVRDLPDVNIANLYALYPDGVIDLEAEVERLLAADRLVLQFPMYWYSTPPLLKAWQDAVLTPILYAKPEVGAKLKGKPIRVVTTTSGEAEAYAHDGRNLFTVEEMFTPLRAMANRSGFVWEPVLAFHSVMQASAEQRALNGARYRAMLEGESLSRAA